LHPVYLHTKINTAMLPAPLLYYINEALLVQIPSHVRGSIAVTACSPSCYTMLHNTGGVPVFCSIV